MNKITYLFFLLLALGCKAKSSGVDSTEVSKQESAHHNSRNSLDWVGTYYGILPCADCMGIQKKVTLKKEQSIEIHTVYLVKNKSKNNPFRTSNNFKWDKSGNQIWIEDQGEKTFFKVEENQLRQVDQEGEKVEGELAEFYILKKGGANLENKYWRAIELMGERVPSESRMKKAPHLIFRSNGEFSGSGGCNSLFGNYQVEKKNWISFSNLAISEMVCEIDSYDEQLMQALSMAQQFTLIGEDRMQLTVGKRAPLAIFETVFPNKEGEKK